MGRNIEINIEKDNIVIASYKLPYGSKLFVKPDEKVKKIKKFVSGILIHHQLLQKLLE